MDTHNRNRGRKGKKRQQTTNSGREKQKNNHGTVNTPNRKGKKEVQEPTAISPDDA